MIANVGVFEIFGKSCKDFGIEVNTIGEIANYRRRQ